VVHAACLDEVINRKILSLESKCEVLTTYLNSTDFEQPAVLSDVSVIKNDFM